MTTVKICGVRTVEHAHVAARGGASMIGLVFAPSRRQVDPERACEISRAARDHRGMKTVGVFVNEAVERINRLVREVGLDLVQLAGDEPDDDIFRLDAPVIRTVHIHPGTDSAALAVRIGAIPAELVLLDTGRAGAYGGTGAPFDWDALPPIDRPFLLAGGLTPDNVHRAIATVHPWGVDVSGGVETDGVKDPSKIEAFLAAARREVPARRGDGVS